MNFLYRPFPLNRVDPVTKLDYAWRPVLKVLIWYQHKKSPPLESILDTGADHCIFDAEIGDELGIPVTTGAKTGSGAFFYLVEVLIDVAIRLLPIDEREAREMLRELRGYKVLEGVRGQGPRDVDALVKAMVDLSDIFAAHRNHLTDMEINPIMVRAQGSGVAAVDVRMIRK